MKILRTPFLPVGALRAIELVEFMPEGQGEPYGRVLIGPARVMPTTWLLVDRLQGFPLRFAAVCEALGASILAINLGRGVPPAAILDACARHAVVFVVWETNSHAAVDLEAAGFTPSLVHRDIYLCNLPRTQ